MSKQIASRVVSISAVILLLAAVTNAYTVIMLGGQRIEIPSHFIVTPATLTYEVASGIQITISVAAIDISATEKANHEQPGSLLARAKSGTAELTVPPYGNEKRQEISRAVPTITNHDLETLKRRRLGNEAAYEKKRKQLGLPSMEEQRRLAAVEFDSATMELARSRITKLESEHYWRARAAALRTEMAALDAELGFLRARLDEVPFATPLLGLGTSSTSISSIVGFGFRTGGHSGSRSFGNFSGRGLHGQVGPRPGVYASPAYGPQMRLRVGFGGGATRGQVVVNSGGWHLSRQTGGGASGGFLPNVAVLGSAFQGIDFINERSGLITRFNELAAARAGLNARWRELEDESRRAGIPPGWLRP